MRTRSSVMNLIYAFAGQGIGLVISFIARIIFLKYLSEEYLGLNGLFTNLLTVLSLVELGVGPAMTFSLYKPLAEHDQEKIKTLMHLYKKMYRIIGCLIMIIGLTLTPFLPFFIHETPRIQNVKWIYILFLTNSVVSYFYSYKRSLIINDQKRYIATVYRYTSYFFLNVVQILLLVITRNYMLFLLAQILFTWMENYFLSKKADKMYPYLKEKTTEELDEKTTLVLKRNIFAMVFHKIGAIIVDSSDNILLSKFVGLAAVGIYSNYTLIMQALVTMIDQVFHSIAASVGNLRATESEEHMIKIFYVTFFMNFCIYGVCSICLLNVINSLIGWWLGGRYVYDDIWIVVALVIKFYIKGMRKTVLTFRDAAGVYWQDRYKPIAESMINIVVSIFLVRKMGVMGIFIGTIISSIATCFWIEPWILYRDVFHENVGRYFLRFSGYTIMLILAAVCSYSICSIGFSSGIVTIMINGMISIAVCVVLITICYVRSEEFQYLKQVLIKIIQRKL